MTTTRRVAFADESAVTIPATGQRVYVLAATVVDANADIGDIRQRMRGLYLARRRRGEGSHPAKLHPAAPTSATPNAKASGGGHYATVHCGKW